MTSKPITRYDIEGVCTLLPGEVTGRNVPVRSGFRPSHLVSEGVRTTGVHKYVDKEELNPGESASVLVTFLSPELYPHTLWLGKDIPILVSQPPE